MISTNIYGQRFHERVEQKPKYPQKEKQKIDKTLATEDNG